MAKPSVFIIGAGVAGLACGRVLTAAGCDVRLADKGRGPGGRCSTRRSDVGRFDHGAPFFTASDPSFSEQVQTWVEAGVVAEWQGSFAIRNDDDVRSPLYVGTPAMNAFVRFEAEALGADYGVQLGRPKSKPGGFDLYRADGAPVGEADVVVVATPAPQAAQLLPEGSALQARAAQAEMLPCWTLMAAFPDDAPGALLEMEERAEGPLEKVIWQGGRPGRDPGRRLVAHATATWAAGHLEDDAETVAAALEHALGFDTPAQFRTAHRWRYARAVKTGEPRYGLDLDAGLATCGDWQAGPNVEDAWLSGYELGRRLTAELG
ncbi:MAG: NAD(P)-binding protein [Pseudomonadota bacterium]